MEHTYIPAEARHEIQFLVSLLKISNPGKPSPECEALELLLTPQASR